MKIWLDAQLSPAIGKWMEEAFDITEAFAVQADSALRATKDLEIFHMARKAEAVVMTKAPGLRTSVKARRLTSMFPGPLASLTPPTWPRTLVVGHVGSI